uniref:Uncharacterized protein n=1 Tax=Anguilla anguilla TaxID=7936 RepID=A0A0E9VX34_ANGAN
MGSRIFQEKHFSPPAKMNAPLIANSHRYTFF